MVVALPLPMTYSGIYVIGYVLDVSIQGFGHRINIFMTYGGTLIPIEEHYRVCWFNVLDVSIQGFGHGDKYI